MRFHLYDRIIEQTPERIVAIKYVTLAEEYLADHFPTFPVLPGVLMVESMVQAARRMLTDRDDAPSVPLVLGEVKALKFSSMVRPGEALEVEVTLMKIDEEGFVCRGIGRRRCDDADGTDGDTAVSGRFTLRPLRGT